MSETLHLVRLVLDRRALARVATRHRLRPNIDEGYFVHAGLSQLFATSSEPASVPFRSFAVDDLHSASQGRPELLYVLAYASEPHSVLIDRMGPARQEILQVCKSREVPPFHAGQQFTFRTRVCPVVRTKVVASKPLTLDKRGRTKGREVDAFLHAALQVPRETEVSRERVYVDWLRKQIQALGACTLGEAKLAEFRRDVMRRKGGGPIERPNAVLQGALTVANPTEFHSLVARGVGRHRAFGFGMLLLAAAGTTF